MCSMKQPYTTSPILDHALDVTGTQSELARQMGVTRAAVTHWRKHLPYKVALELVQRYGKKKPRDPVATWLEKFNNKRKEAK